jgi:hypothetical protein
MASPDWNFHVLSRGDDGLFTHHIHSALPHDHKDLIRTGEIGALYGGVLLFLVALLCVALAWLTTWLDVVMVSLIGTAISGLVGIRVGLSRDNVRLETFHADIDAGKFLILVDVRKKDKPKIRELLNMEFSGVAYHGNESTFVRPFKACERVIPRRFSDGALDSAGFRMPYRSPN